MRLLIFQSNFIRKGVSEIVQIVGIARLDDYMEFHNAKKAGERKVTQTFEIKWEE